MIFKEIELAEALQMIGEGNPDRNLFFYKGVGRYDDLKNYEANKIEANDIRHNKWFIRVEVAE